jgi:hypothetical protein
MKLYIFSPFFRVLWTLFVYKMSHPGLMYSLASFFCNLRNIFFTKRAKLLILWVSPA